MQRLPVALILTALLSTPGLVRAGWPEGVAAFRGGDFATAAAEFQQVVRERPEFAGGHFMLGQSLVQLDQPAQALTPLRQAYDLEPNNVQYALALAHAYLRVREFESAFQLYERIDPNSLPEPMRDQYLQGRAVAAAEVHGE